MYKLKKIYLTCIGWWYSGWGKHCYYGRKVEVLREGKVVGGIIVIDQRKGQTVILCDDGVIQYGGLYRST